MTTSIAFATPIVSSQSNQTFDKNQGVEQLNSITITESTDGIFIEKGELRLTLPDDLELIFDDERSESEVLLYGDAVDNGKMLESPEIRWENNDKTVVIPVLEDFDLGESVVVSKLFVEGFNSSSANSSHLWLTLSDDEEVYLDTYYLDIQESSYSDNNQPATPSNVLLVSTDDGIEITWDDPTDLDLQTIEVLRGVSPLPVDGHYFALVAEGDEYYLDNDAEEGDVITYILRASDGRNYSANSEEFTITYSVPVEEVVEEEEEIVEEEEEVIEEVIEEEVTEEEEEEIVVTVDFDDLDGHWGEDAVEELAAESIVEGDPDGSFRPDDSLNRAEAATLMARIMYEWVEFEALTTDYESPFSDLNDEDWYFEDVINLYSYGAVNGNPDGTFAPAKNINRAEFLQLAVNLYEALNEELNSDELTSDYFSDIASSDWYYRAVALAADEGWVQGSECDGETCFMPANEITRAEAAQILHNMFYELITQ